MLQKEVISPGKRYEMSMGNPSRHLTACIDRDHEIVTNMHDERRHLHLREQLAHIDISHDVEVASRAFRRRGPALKVIEPISLFLCTLRNELRGEHLPECRIGHAPTKAHQSPHRLALLMLLWRSLGAAQRKAPIQNQVRKALRMPRRIGNGNGTPLGDATASKSRTHASSDTSSTSQSDSPLPRASYRTSV